MDGSKQADMNSGDHSQDTPKPQAPYLMGADDTPQSAGTSEIRPDAASTAEQYRAVMEAAEEGIWLLDAFHKGVFVNRRMADMLGYAVPDLLGRSFYDFVEPAGELEVAADFRDQRLGRRTRRELGLLHKSGRRIAVLSSAAPVFNGKGEYAGTLGMLTDLSKRGVHERIDAPPTAELSPELVRPAAENGSWRWDITTDSFSCSADFCRLLGIRPDTSPHSLDQFLAFVHPTDRAAVDATIRKASAKAESFTLDLRMVRRDGRIYHLTTQGEVLRAEDGSAMTVLGVCLNVTEQKEERRKHFDNAELLDLLLERGTGYAIFMVSPTGHMTTWNEGARRLTGFLEDTKGQHISILFADGAQSWRMPHRLLENARSQGHAEDEGWNLRKDGTLYWASVAVTALLDRSGELRAFGVIVRDLTDWKLSQDRQDAYAKGLQGLSNWLVQTQEVERQKLATEIYDELGQSLTALKLELQKTAVRLPDDAAADLGKSLTLVDALIRQTRDLSLDLRPRMLQDLGLTAALQWHIDTQVRLSGLDAELDLQDVPADLPNELATSCFRIIQEATANVLKHAQASRISIQLSGKNSHLELVISDNGNGFEVSELEEKQAELRHFGIFGMQERARAWGGTLSVSSRIGEGSTVMASLPLAKRDVAGKTIN